jgi:uncharacterized membrane protein YkoI
MKTKSISSIFLLFVLPLAPLSMAVAGEVPSPKGKPLSEILQSVEAQKSGVIPKAEYDDGLWEVRVCDASACQKLYIDPRSGEQKRRKKADSEKIPPANAMPISKIVQSVEARGLGIITEVEFDEGFWHVFDEGFWNVELRKDGRKVKVGIDAITGEIKGSAK